MMMTMCWILWMSSTFPVAVGEIVGPAPVGLKKRPIASAAAIGNKAMIGRVMSSKIPHVRDARVKDGCEFLLPSQPGGDAHEQVVIGILRGLGCELGPDGGGDAPRRLRRRARIEQMTPHDVT